MAKDLTRVARDYERLSEEESYIRLAASRGLPYINLVNYPFVGDVLGLIPEETARKYRVVAFMKVGATVRVASPDPFAENLPPTMNELGRRLGKIFEPHYCSKTSLNYALGLYPILVPRERQDSQITAEKSSKETFSARIKNLRDLKETIAKASTTKLLEIIIEGALALEATDIHFEPGEKAVAVRFRIDGRLLPIIEIPEKSYKLVSSRIKTSAGIKLDRQQVSQDGRFSVNVPDQQLDIRVNTVPSAYGETIELRLLTFKRFLTLDQLNFPEATKQAILAATKRPQGLILFTGPTGSGKTTSLYAVLSLLNQPEKKVVTIEDPIEYRLNGIEQVQVRPDQGFDFPQALRAVLRQDPDVIMVGEIRDKETAEIAVDAALTGHLVLSTLHTNSSSAAFARLLQMGVPKYLLSDAISLVVAQRLVRQFCPNCHGNKCDLCNQTGFKGRFLIAEHFVPEEKTIDLIRREASLTEFEQLFKALGYKSLAEDGLDKVKTGLTSEAEVNSVVGS